MRFFQFVSAACLLLAGGVPAQELCTVVDPDVMLVSCPESGFFCFADMGTGYAALAYTPPGQQQPWMFFFQMIAGGLPPVVNGSSSHISCSDFPAGTVVWVNHWGGVVPTPTFTYHQNAGDGGYFDIKFIGGDGGRSSEITYYCNQQGTGIASFQYDYESPQLNYQAAIQGPQACKGSPTKPVCELPPPPPPPSPPLPPPPPLTCASAQHGGAMPRVSPQFTAQISITVESTSGVTSGTLWVDSTKNLARLMESTTGSESLDSLQILPGTVGSTVYETYRNGTNEFCNYFDGSKATNFGKLWSDATNFTCLESNVTFNALTCDVWVRSVPSVVEIWWCAIGTDAHFPARTLQVDVGTDGVALLSVTEFRAFTPSVPKVPNVFQVNPPCRPKL